LHSPRRILRQLQIPNPADYKRENCTVEVGVDISHESIFSLVGRVYLFLTLAFFQHLVKVKAKKRMR